MSESEAGQAGQRRRGIGGPRKAFNVRLPMHQAAMVKRLAERWKVTDTAAATRILQEGIAREDGAPEPGEEFQALAFTLGAILDRLESLERLSLLTTRAAVKGGMAAQRGLALHSPEEQKRVAEAASKILDENGVEA